MELSEAIRLGAMLKPQGSGGINDGRTACALRAAADAVGICDVSGIDFRPTLDYAAIADRWPWVKGLDLKCPECGSHHYQNALDTIWILNDTHKWTRERIADWIETIEAPASETAVEPSESADAVAGTVEQPQAVHSR